MNKELLENPLVLITDKKISAVPDLLPALEKRLEALAGAIVSKLLHEPSVRLRKAGSDEQGGQELMAAAARIFDVQGIEAPRA